GAKIMQLMELMELCTTLSDRVLALENNKTAWDLEITHLKNRVKRLEKKRKSRTLQLTRRLFKVRIESSTKNSLGDQDDVSNQGRNNQDEEISFVQDAEIQGSAPITTAGVSVSTAEPSNPPTTTTTLIEDEYLTISQTLMKIRSVKSKEKSKGKGVSSTRLTRGVIMKEASETASRPIVPPQQQLGPKDKRKEVLEGSGKKAERSGKEAVSKKRTEEEFDQESSKRQKTSESSELAKEPRDKEADELSQEELQQMMIIVPVQGMNVEALQTKEGNRHLHAGREGVSIVKRNSYIDVGCNALGGSR
nr:hypothetical protein [Tanacetum cinerariifolium]